jgi:hypothetical protein
MAFIRVEAYKDELSLTVVVVLHAKKVKLGKTYKLLCNCDKGVNLLQACRMHVPA